jgi:putative transposase
MDQVTEVWGHRYPCLYLVTRSLDPTVTGRTKWAVRWKPALNAFAVTFGDRFPAAETY